MDTEQFIDYFRFHSDAIRFVTDRDPKRKGVSHGLVLSAMCAAYYNEDRGRIAEFQAQLISGEIADPQDSAVLRLRDWVLTKDTSGGHAVRMDLWLRSCAALRAYCARKPLKRLSATPASCYPLPRIPGLKLD